MTQFEGMLIAGRYEVREHIATGGMASVFKTWDHRVERLVAMKVLRALDKNDLRAVERFGREARAAAKTVGVNKIEFLPLHTQVPLMDQRLYRSLPQAFSALSTIVERLDPGCLLTLAYEGGHPDHDAVSFLTAQLGRTFSLPVWETPLYHRSESGGGVFQQFVEERGEVVEHPVAGEELDAKLRMLGCYKSQFDALPSFDSARERFRPQVAYDYSRPPHAGKLNYEIWQWRMTPQEVCAAFVDFSSSMTPLEKTVR